MKRIYVFSPGEHDATNFYRGMGPFSRLREPGVIAEPIPYRVDWESILGGDLCVMLRPYTKEHLRAAQIIADQMPLWLDYDDLLTGVPPENPAFKHYHDCHEVLQELIPLASQVTVTTPGLKEAFDPLTKSTGPEIEVIPNAWDDTRLWRLPPFPKRGKTVLWRGSETHIYDLLAHRKSIQEAISAHPHWNFLFWGQAPWMFNGNNVNYAPGVDLFEYFRTMGEKLDARILMVPLAFSPFNRCKSNLAAIEAGMAGMLTVGPQGPGWEEWEGPTVAGYSPDKAIGEVLHELIGEADQLGTDAWEEPAPDSVWKQRLLTEVNVRRAELVRELLR